MNENIENKLATIKSLLAIMNTLIAHVRNAHLECPTSSQLMFLFVEARSWELRATSRTWRAFLTFLDEWMSNDVNLESLMYDYRFPNGTAFVSRAIELYTMHLESYLITSEKIGADVSTLDYEWLLSDIEDIIREAIAIYATV